MGTILKAFCQCGLELNGIMQGFGDNYIVDKVLFEAVYCDGCGIVDSRDANGIAPCEQCGNNMTFYKGQAKEDFNSTGLPFSEPPLGLQLPGV